MHKLFLFIYRQPLSRIVLCMFLLVFLWAYLGYREKNSLRWRLVNGAVFIGIMAVIFYMTVYTRGENPGEPVLALFQSFQTAKIQPEIYRSMLMNVFLFVPLGLSLPFVLGSGRLPEVFTVLLAFVFSVVIEYLQYRHGLGWCEVDDVIMNTIGTFIGTLAYWLSRKWKQRIVWE